MAGAQQHTAVNAAALARGQAELERVIQRAERGQDAFQHQPIAKAKVAEPDAVNTEDPDIAQFERFIQRYGNNMLVLAYVVAQAFSWVLIKGALISMHTPAVLTFLHLLSAAALQLLLASYGLLEQPKIASSAAKGAAVHACINGLQVLLVMAILSYSSVYMLLCLITVAPILIGFSRLADVISSKGWTRHIPAQLQLPLAAACTGLGLELLFDQHSGVLPLLLLLAWCCTVVLQHLWRQVKVDATLGHRIMDPDFLFRARELSDLEDALSPSTLRFMSAVLPAIPVLLLGFICLEGKDLVEHEPSVPTLSVLLLSCVAFAAAHNLRLLMTYTWGHRESSTQSQHQHEGLLLAAAAMVAVVLDFMERAHVLGVLCLLGVSMATAGSFAVHWLQQGPALHWLGVRSMKGGALHSI